LLFRESELRDVIGILLELGYVGSDPQVDLLTSYQCSFSRRDSFGVQHSLDIHWKINNAHVFAEKFTFDDLFTQAVRITSLAPSALGLSCVHALLLACMHRFGHAHAPFYTDGGVVHAGDHLRWVYDIHLLCSVLNDAEWSEVLMLSSEKKIAKYCIDGLAAASDAFLTRVPSETMSDLRAAALNEGASAHALRSSATAWFLVNLCALPNLRRRITLLKQVVFPPRAYMIEKYKINNRLALPFLYGYRSASGILKRMKHGGS